MLLRGWGSKSLEFSPWGNWNRYRESCHLISARVWQLLRLRYQFPWGSKPTDLGPGVKTDRFATFRLTLFRASFIVACVSDKLFYLEPIAEIIETCILSAFIPENAPISIILVGASGLAKSKLIKRYGDEFIHHTDSVSQAGLADMVQKDHKNEKKVIMIPDMNPTLSRKPSTANSAVANLLTLTNDGTVRIDDGRDRKECKHDPMALVTACTREIYDRHAKQWFALGLRRRIIPIFYSYTTETENNLQRLVRENKIQTAMLPPVSLKHRIIKIADINGEYAIELQNLSTQFAVNLGKISYFADSILKWEVKKIIPVSPHATIRNLCRAHAMWRGSRSISKDDIRFVSGFIDFSDPQTVRKI
jgi:hypothetical protein